MGNAHRANNRFARGKSVGAIGVEFESINRLTG